MKRQKLCGTGRSWRSKFLSYAFSCTSITLPFLLLLFLFSPPGEAAQIKQVQRQAVTFGDYETVKQQTLPNSVDLEKSFVISTSQSDDLHASSVSQSVRTDGGEGLGLYMSNFEDGSTVNIERVRATDKGDNFPGTVQISEIEFGQNAKVYRGFSTFGDTTVTKNIALPTLQSGTYFPIVSVKATEWFVDETEAFKIKASFPDNNTLRLERKDGTLGYQNTGPTSVTVAWQVIQLLTDAKVQKGEITISGASTSATVNLTQSPLTAIADINKAFLVFTYTGGAYGAGLAGVDAQTMVRGTITDVNTLTFTRGVGGAADDEIYIAWYLIELQDDSSLVQKGTMNFLATEFTKTKADLTAVNLTRAFSLVSVAGGTSNTNNVNLHNYLVRSALTDGNTLTLTRTDDTDLGTGVAEIAVDADWFVVEFAPLTLTAPNTQVALAIGDPCTITWNYADSLKTGGGGTNSVHRVKLEISKDGTNYYGIPDASSLDVDTGTPDNTHSFTWPAVPANISTDIANMIGETFKVKITDIETGTAPRNYDRSNVDFVIKGKLTPDQPPSDAASIWKIGQTVNLGWTTRGNMSSLATKTVTLEVSPNGTDFYEITTTPADPEAGNDNVHSTATTWSIPELIGGKSLVGTNKLLRITSDYNPAPADLTKVQGVTSAFTIKPVISNVRVTESDGTTLINTTDHPVLKADAVDYKIKWDKLGHWGDNDTEGNVDILYSENGGSSYTPLSVGYNQPSGAHDTGGTFNWTTIAPAATPSGQTSKIKVIQHGDDTVGAESGAFLIKVGNVFLSSPNGGTFDLGDTTVNPLNITWTASANLTTVDFYFSPNNGGKWIKLNDTPVAANAGTYPFPWSSANLIDSPVTTEGLIKVASTEYPTTVNSTSTSNFTIQAGINVTSPGAGDNWDIGDITKRVVWTQTGTFDSVKITIVRNGVTSPTEFVTVPKTDANYQNYPWPVIPPTSSVNNAFIKVEHTKWPTISGTSGGFTVRAKITADNPASPPWRVGTTPTVTWSLAGTVDKVDILYKKGVAGTPVCLTPPDTGVDADNVDATHGSWSWSPYNLYDKVPNDLSDETYLIVRDHDHNEIQSVNPTPFKIKGSIAFLQQIGGGLGYVKAGEKQTINFEVKGSVGVKTVNLRLSTDGVNYGDPVATTPINGANTYSIEWTPQGSDYGTDRVLKLGIDGDEVLGPGVATTSNTFDIEPGIKLDYPSAQGLGPFNMNGSVTIRWTPNPSNVSFGKVKIQWIKNGGEATGWITPDQIESNNLEGGSIGYLWQLNDGNACGSAIKVKIFLDVDGKRDIVYSESVYSFAILGGVLLQDDAKNGGVTWEMDAPHSISWIPTGDIGKINILYSKAPTPSYDYYVVKNIDAGLSGVKSSYPWTILYSTSVKDGCVDFERNANVRFKIETVDHAITDVSTNPLTIKAKLALNSPSGTLTPLKIYAQDNLNKVDIDWNTYKSCSEAEGCDPAEPPAVSKVKIEYSANGGDYTPIETGVYEYDNAGGWMWAVPTTVPVGDNLLVRVSSKDYADISSVSTEACRVIGQIKIDQPAGVTGANAWTVSDATHGFPNTKSITWTNYGTMKGTVKVMYSATGDFVNAENYTVLDAIATGANGQHSIDFVVPDKIGATNQIKITDNDATATKADPALSANFEIKGDLQIIEPAGGESYDINSLEDIRWKYSGDLSKSGNLNMFYLAYDEAGQPIGNWQQINQSGVVAYNNLEGTDHICKYAWNVPSLHNIRYRVKIVAANDSDVWAMTGFDKNGQPSGSPYFAVKGSVVLTAPGKKPIEEPTEKWYVDSQNVNTITWTRLGQIPYVDLYVIPDSGSMSTEYLIQANVPADPPSFKWNIPPSEEAFRQLVTSEKARIRIYVSGEIDKSDASTRDFSIKPRLTITPLAGTPWKVEDERQISWSKTGKIDKVKVIFNNGTQTEVLGDPTGNTGSAINWIIDPDSGIEKVTNSATIKVVRFDGGVEDNDVTSTSDPSFTIDGNIKNVQTGATTLYAGQAGATISWQIKGTVGDLQLRYSIDAANNYPSASFNPVTGCETIPAGTTNKTFTVPMDVGAVKFRVVEKTKSDRVFGDSGVCTVKGSLQLEAASTQLQNLTVGAEHTVRWSTSGTFQALEAFYIIDGVKKPIPGAIGPGVTSIKWTPGDGDISNDIIFRVEDPTERSNGDQTPADKKNTVAGLFEIRSPSATLNNDLVVGQTGEYVQWFKQGEFGKLHIELYDSDNTLVPDNQSNLVLGLLDDDGSSGVVNHYDWTVPDKIGKQHVKIRITPELHAADYTRESVLFSIKGGFTPNSVASPAADGTWLVGSGSKNIIWEGNGLMNNVRIELSIQDGSPRQYLVATPIADGITPVVVSPGVYKYVWAFDDILADQRSTDCKIRIIDKDNASSILESNGTFTIKPEIVPVTPSQPWVANTNPQVEWGAIAGNATSTIDIILDNDGDGFGDGGDQVLTPANGISKTTTQPYPVANQLSSKITTGANAMIRIRDHDKPSVVYGDSGSFVIKGEITVSPQSTPWTLGEADKLINWTYKGDISTVKIYADYNGDGTNDETLTPVAVSAGSNGSGSWTWPTVPDKVSNDVIIRVEAQGTPQAVIGESAKFHILGKFEITAPSGLPVHIEKESAIPGESVDIKCKAWGSDIQTVKLEYSLTGVEGTFIPIIDGLTLSKKDGTEILLYTWDRTSPVPIPTNVTSKDVKVRIYPSSPLQPEAKKDSSTFVICGSIYVDPFAQTTWEADGTTEHTISWEVAGDIPKVDVLYSRDGTPGGYVAIPNRSNIDGHAAGSNLGSCTWTVPSSVTEEWLSNGKVAKIMVRDTRLDYRTFVQGESGTFTVKGILTFEPDTLTMLGTGITAGVQKQIVVRRKGKIDAVQLKYSNSNDLVNFPNNISTANFSPGEATVSIDWTPPETRGAQARGNGYALQITDTEYPNSSTKTVSPLFTVRGETKFAGITASPTPGTYYIGNTPTVTWSILHGDLTDVKVIASRSGEFSGTIPGNDIFVIATGSGGSAQWNIQDLTPTICTSTVKIKIIDADDAYIGVDGAQAISPAYTVKGALTVEKPTDDWNVGDINRLIIWTPKGNVSKVNVYFSPDNGADGSWIPVTDPSQGTTGTDYGVGQKSFSTANWYKAPGDTSIGVPDVKKKTCKIKVCDFTYPDDIVAISADTFNVYPKISNVTLVASPGTETLDPPYIVWRAQLDGTQVKWTDTSTNVSNVNIYYSPDGTANFGAGAIATAASTTNGENTATFTSPAGLSNARNALIRVKDADAAFADLIYADSAAFRLVGRIEIDNDRFSEDWKVGETTRKISWTAFGTELANVNIYIDYGTGYGTNPIATLNAATGTPWSFDDPYYLPDPGVSDCVSTSVKVKITDANASRKPYTQFESVPFKIAGVFSGLTVTPYNAAEENAPVAGLFEGTKIAWTRVGTAIQNVRLEYNNNNGVGQWTPLAPEDLIPAGENKKFTPPAADIKDNVCFIRITDPNNPNTTLTSAPFSVKSKVKVTEPDGSVAWEVGKPVTVKWSKWGDFDTVNVYYRAQPTDEWGLPVASGAAHKVGDENSGEITFTLPTTTTLAVGTAQVKVEDAAKPNLCIAVPSASFSTIGSVEVLKPDNIDPNRYIAGTNLTIRWKRIGTVPAVDVYYSKDGGETWGDGTSQRILTNEAFPVGSDIDEMSWTLPEEIGEYMIEVRDATPLSTIKNRSPKFTVGGELEITKPEQSGVVYEINKAGQTIEWNVVHGNISNVKIIGSRDGDFDDHGTPGSDMFVISSMTDADNIKTFLPGNLYPKGQGQLTFTFPEKTPTICGNKVKIRVMDYDTAKYPLVKDDSYNYCTIMGRFEFYETPPATPVQCDKPFTIKWYTHGNIGAVQLKYRTGPSGTYTSIPSGAISNNKGTEAGAQMTTLSWSPDGQTVGVCSQAQIQIVQTDGPDGQNAELESSSFAIGGWFEFQAGSLPAANASWEIQPTAAHLISWTNHGVETPIRLQYDSTGTGTWQDIEDNVPNTNTIGTTGFYSWTPGPATILNKFSRIRVGKAGAAIDSNNDISESFSLHGKVSITDPVDAVDGRNFKFGRGYPVQFGVVKGQNMKVRLDYAVVSGVPQPADFTHTLTTDVSLNAGQNSSFQWNVSEATGDVQSTNVVIRAADQADPEHCYAYTSLDNRFRIQCTFNVTQPNGAPWQVDDSEQIVWTSTAGACSRVNIWYTANARDAEPDWVLLTPAATYPLGYPNLPVGQQNSFPWKVTDPRADYCKVKVTDKRDDLAEALSAEFAIKGSIKVNDPNTHQDLDIGGNHDILWETFGNIDKVSIWYSVDQNDWALDTDLPGNPIATEITLADYQQPDGTYKYPWQPVPDQVNDYVKIVVAPSDLTEGDISDAYSTIRAVLTLDAIEPVLRVGDEKIIAWSKQGTIDTVKIELSLDNFGGDPSKNFTLDNAYDADATPAGTPANRFGYVWNILKDHMCKLPTDAARIRIQSSDQTIQPSTVAIAGPFLIKGAVEMLHPHTAVLDADKLDVDGHYDIEWKTFGDLNAIPNAKFKLLLDPEGDGTYLATPLTSTADPGNDNTTSTFHWDPIPNFPLDTLIIKGVLTVSGAEDSTVYDLTSPFTIRPNIEMLFPNASTDYIIHQKAEQYITWKKHGTISTVDIKLDASGGLDDYNIPVASGVSAAAEKYLWTTIRDLNGDADTLSGDTFKIKISDSVGTQTKPGVSAQSFKIRGSVAFDPTSMPQKNEVWLIGDTKQIRWSKVGPISTVILEYSTGGGVYNRVTYPNGDPVPEIVLSGAGPYSFDWKIPPAAKSTTCKLRIREKRGTDAAPIIDVYDIRPQSTDTFIMRGGYTWKANKPPVGQVYELTETIPLEWDTFGGMTNVRLEFSTNNNNWFPVKTTAIIPDTKNAVLLLDLAKQGIDVANPFYIRLQDPDDEEAQATVQVKVKGKITWTSPTGATTWKAGEAGVISWTSLGSIGIVTVDYIRQEGGGDNIDEVQATDNGCPWPTIPPEAVGTIKIHLTQQSDETVTWDSVWVPVKANFVFDQPNATTTWYVDDQEDIIWTTYGSISSVNIEYWGKKPDNTLDWLPVTSGFANNPTSGSQTTFPWPQVPDNIRDDVKIKVSDAGTSGTISESAPFKIRGLISLVDPTEPLKIGRQYKIEWTEKGHADKVEIWFHYGDGNWFQIEHPTLGKEIPNTTRSYTWPAVMDVDLPLEDAQFRIKTVGYDIEDYSATFKVIPDFTFSHPSLYEVFTVNSSPNISWTCTSDNVEFVNLEYSVVPGVFHPINVAAIDVTDTYPNEVQYPWSLTNQSDCSSTAVIRITADVVGASVQGSALSKQFFIRPILGLQTPNSNPDEKFVIGRQNNIVWQCAGKLSQVRLQYSAAGDFSDIQDLPGVAGGLVTNVVGQNTFPWNIPDGLFTDNAKIRVTAPDTINGVDDSEQKFKIVAGFTMDAPNGTLEYKAGGDIPILWKCTSKGEVGFVPKVNFAYSINNQAYVEFAWDIPNPAVAGNQGSYTWLNIPEDIITTNAKIKVIDAGDDHAFEPSVPFVIKADFDMLQPGGSANQTLTVGDPLEIQWKCKGAVSTVKLQYSYNAADPDSWVNLLGEESTTISNPAPDAQGIRKFTVVGGVPNIIGKEVWFRVCDAVSGHPASYGVSDFKFRVKGALNITAPRNPGAVPPESNKLAMEIAEDFDITWTEKGTIPTVIIDYCDLDTSFGAEHTYPIITIDSEDCLQGDGTYLYNWPSVPDNANGTSYIRIRDSRTTDFPEVQSISDIFRIKGYIKVISPNGVDDEKWRVGDPTKSIQLEWSGTMAEIGLSISKDGENGTFNDLPVNATIDTHTYIGKGPHTLTVPWTVVDAISDQVRLKATYLADTGVSDISDDDFTIYGGLTINSPGDAANKRWVTQEDFRTITWSTDGDIDTVNLEYRKYNADGSLKVVTDAQGIVIDDGIVEIESNVTNLNSYPWEIPNDRCEYVKVKIYDPRFPTLSVDESDYFKIDYYTVYFEVRDLLTGSNISQLTFKGGSSEGLTYETSYDPTAPALPLGSPMTLQLPYGHWSALITRTSYGDIQTMFTVNKDLLQSDPAWFPVEGKGMLHMETSAIHIWRAYSDFTYKPDDPLVPGNDDKLSISSWLERDGFMVSGGEQTDVYIYDEAGNEVKHLGAPEGVGAVGVNPDSAGFFHLEWAGTTLLPGKVYTVVTDIRNAAKAHFRTPTSFSVTESQQMQAMVDKVNWALDKPITEVEDSISTTLGNKLDEQTEVILGTPPSGQTMEEYKANIMAQGGIVGMVQDSLTSFSNESKLVIGDLKTGAQSAVDAGNQLVTTAKRYSWNASASPDPALTNDFVTISCQGEPDKMPMLSIYSWDNKIIITNTVMREVRPGFYTYQFQVDSARFTAGKAYTYIINEQDTGGLVSGSAMVESMGISAVAGLAAAAPEAERAAKNALDAIKAVEAVLVTGDNINISLTLKNLKESVDELPGLLSQEGPSNKVLGAINEISEKLKYFMGEEGIDLGELLDEKLGDTSSIRDVRNKTDSINSVVDLLLQILEARLGGVDAPIISTSLQAGSVKFRIMVVNPSKAKTQKVQVKKFLPAEVKPKDVMDLGGLSLDYDSERSIYYVYKNDVELKPGAARVFEVEVEDIWMVSDAVLAEVRQKTDELVGRVRGSAYEAKVKAVTDTVYPVLEEIPRTQADDTISREQHIGVYRQNMQSIELITDKLAKLELMIQPGKGVVTPEVLEKSKLKINLPVKTTTWLIILLVIVFLGILATVFFIVWQTQVRFSQNAIEQARKESFPQAKPQDKNAPPK